MTQRVAWGAWWFGLAARVLQLWLAVHPAPDRVFMAFGIGPLTFLAAILFGTSASAVGVLMATRVPGNRFGWIWIATGVAQAILALLLLLSADTVARGGTVAVAAGLFASAGVQTAPFLSTGFGLLTFPDGRFASPSWRLVGWGLLTAASLRILEIVLGSPAVFLLPTVANPFTAGGAVGSLLATSASAGLGLRLIQLGVVAGAMSTALRYRGVDLPGRRQIRWFLLGAAVLVVTLVPSAYVLLVVGSREPATAGIFALAFVGYSLLPIATLVAITRYRLYEVDRIINRAILYGSLTAILAGTFTAAVALAQRLFVAATGERSDAAIVLTTLVVATAYAPLRKRLEGFVDRRFKYEQATFGQYREELVRFLDLADPRRAAERLAREALTELRATGIAVVSEGGEVIATAGSWPTIEAARVSIAVGDGALAAIVAGPRTDGAPHDPARLADLADLGRLTAAAARVGAKG